MTTGDDAEAAISPIWPRGRLAAALRDDAQSYLEAARVLAKNDLRGSLRPTYFLLCHGVELALKAFLAAKDASDEFIRKKVGHRLDKAFEESAALGLSDPESKFRQLVNFLAPFHDEYAFRYRDVEFDHVPEFQEALDRALMMLRSIEPAVMHSLFRDIKTPYEYTYLTRDDPAE
jgi:hypothetical protein